MRKRDYSNLDITAEKIKNEILNQSKESNLSYQDIKTILELETNNKYKLEIYNINYSLLRLDKMQSEIIKTIYKESGVLLSSIDFIKTDIDERIKVFRNAEDNYTLAQYIQNYDILTKRSIFKNHIIKYEDALNKANDFAIELINKYKDADKNIVLKYNSESCLSNNVKHLEELYIILKKKEMKYQLSSCDEVLESIINRIFNIKEKYTNSFENNLDNLIKELTTKIKKELIRVKVLSEIKANYSYLVENIEPYYFHIEKEQEKELVNDLMKKNKSSLKNENGIYFGANKNKSTSKINLLQLLNSNTNTSISLTNTELENGIYICSTPGAGFYKTLNNYFIQTFYNKDANVLFNFDGRYDVIYDFDMAKKITNNKGGIVLITHTQFLNLTKDYILDLLKKEKSIVFSLNVFENFNENMMNKYITKIRYIIEIIGMHKKDKYYNIFINDANYLFNKKNKFGENFANDFHSMKNKFNKTKLFVGGNENIDKDFFKEFKYKILMKTECDLISDTFDNSEVEQKIKKVKINDDKKILENKIRNLKCGDFILIVDNKLSLESNIYSSHYLDFYKLHEEKKTIINIDLNS